MTCRKDGQTVNLENKCVAPHEGEKICGSWKLINGAWLPAATVCSIEPKHRTVFDAVSSSTSGSLTVVPIDPYLGFVEKRANPGECLATECPAGCCGQENWFCCPDNINCAALPEYCPDVLDSSESYDTNGITIQLSNVFNDEVPVMLYRGLTGDMVSVPPGYNYAIFFEDDGNIVTEFVEEGQVLQFHSAIAVGQTDSPTRPYPNPSGRYPCDKFRDKPKAFGGVPKKNVLIHEGQLPASVINEAIRQGIIVNCQNFFKIGVDALKSDKATCDKSCKKPCYQGTEKPPTDESPALYYEVCNFCINSDTTKYKCCDGLGTCDDAATALAKAKDKYGCTESFTSFLREPEECRCYGATRKDEKNPKKTCPPGSKLREGWCEQVVGPGGQSCCTSPPSPLIITGGPNKGQVCKCGTHLEMNPEYHAPSWVPPVKFPPIEVRPGVWAPGYTVPGYWILYDKNGNVTDNPANVPPQFVLFCNEEPDCKGPKEKYVWHPPECYPSLITCCSKGYDGQNSCAENVPYDQCTGYVSDLPCAVFCPVSSSSSSSSNRLDRTGAWCTGEVGCDGRFYIRGCAEGTELEWEFGNATDTVQNFQENGTCPKYGGGENDIQCVVEPLPNCSSSSGSINDKGAWCTGKYGCDGLFYNLYCEQGTLKEWQAKNSANPSGNSLQVQNFNRGLTCLELECNFEFLPECSSSSSSSVSSHFLWCNSASEQGGACSFDPGTPNDRPFSHVWIKTNKVCGQAYCELCQGCDSCTGYHQEETTCGSTNEYKSYMETLGWECISHEESAPFGTCNVAVNCCPKTSSSSG
jgi:hypothetical protein